MSNDFSYLYVEDDDLSRQIMSLIIRGAMGTDNGEFFDDSRDFMQRVHALPFQPDIFLLDIHITPINGYDMLALLRADPAYAHSKIVAVTASIMIDEMAKLRRSGFDGAICKPLNSETLPTVLLRILQGETVWQI